MATDDDAHPPDPDPDLTADDIRVLKRLAEQARAEWPNRRQILGGGAAVAGGALAGLAATQPAAAQPTGDEPVVGQQGDPVEVWASEIDALEVATEELSNEKIIDPSRSDLFTAINSAITELAPEGGKIVVPRPNENNTYAPTADLDLSAGANNQDEDTPIHIEGHASGAGNATGKTVEIDCSNAKVILEDGGNTRRNITLQHLLLDGGGSGDGILVDSSATVGLKNSRFNDVRLKNFNVALHTKNCDVINTRIVDCEFRSNAQHWVHTSNDLNNVMVRDCQFTGATSDPAISLGGVNVEGLVWDGCAFEGNDEGVLDATTTIHHMRMVGTYMEDNNQNGGQGSSPLTFNDVVSNLYMEITEKGHGTNGPFINFLSSSDVRRVKLHNLESRSSGVQLVGGSGLESIEIRNSVVTFDLDLSGFSSAEAVHVFDAGSRTLGANTRFKKDGEGLLFEGYKQVDVRNDVPQQNGTVAFHDGTNSNTAGPAARIGGTWTSLVDGTTIS